MKQEYKYTIIDPYGAKFVYKKIDHPKYKYELVEDYSINIRYKPPDGISIVKDWFAFWADGRLLMKTGYQWDGVSGPMIDTINTMIPGCVHDGGYQMLREGWLPKRYKHMFDLKFETLMKTCSKPNNILGKSWNWTRAKYAYLGVDWFGGRYCKPNKKR